MNFNLKELQDHLKPTKDLLVLDGDWLVFQAMSAAEQETDWGDGVWTLECDHEVARSILHQEVTSWVTRRNSWKKATVVFAFSDDRNWRKELVDETYKENRKATRKPVGYRAFVEALREQPDTICVTEERLEADDVIGIIASNAKAFKAQKVTIISIDKDFRTIPNCDFLWCSTGNIMEQTVESADFWHLYQTMKGDITDGYSGIKGWGEKSEDFLRDPYLLKRTEVVIKSGKNKGDTRVTYEKQTPMNETVWDCILSVAERVDMTEEDVLKQARLARILRYDEYNLSTKEIKLWTFK